MKLSTIFAFAAVSDAKKKKPKTPESEAHKLIRNVKFVWDEWYGFCDLKGRDGRYTRFKTLVQEVHSQVSNCGSDPNAVASGDRKRRSEDDSEEESYSHEELRKEFEATFEENPLPDDPNSAAPRVSKTDRLKAVKQLGNILKRYAENYLVGCQKGLTISKVTQRSKKWSKNLAGMGCADKPMP